MVGYDIDAEQVAPNFELVSHCPFKLLFITTGPVQWQPYKRVCRAIALYSWLRVVLMGSNSWLEMDELGL